VIRRAVFDQHVTHEEARQAIQVLIEMPFEVVGALEQFLLANELARRFQHRNAYDMQYLAVAEIAGADLVTDDRDLGHAAEVIGVRARYLT
jgi:predicted nucleic acid-binding protein